MAERSVFRPYGEASTTDFDLTTADESKGYNGERYDGDAGLQYLNARYYDPKLGMFIQPDWWEVTKAGVGTNPYSYSFGDPVNKSDPSGHEWYNNWGDFKDSFRGSVKQDVNGRTDIKALLLCVH